MVIGGYKADFFGGTNIWQSIINTKIDLLKSINRNFDKCKSLGNIQLKTYFVTLKSSLIFNCIQNKIISVQVFFYLIFYQFSNIKTSFYYTHNILDSFVIKRSVAYLDFKFRQTQNAIYIQFYELDLQGTQTLQMRCLW